MAELFIRGSKDYIARESLGEAVFWLEEEVLKLDPQADLNEAMAGAYVNTPHWEAAKYAERVFARWELTGAGQGEVHDSIIGKCGLEGLATG